MFSALQRKGDGTPSPVRVPRVRRRRQRGFSVVIVVLLIVLLVGAALTLMSGVSSEFLVAGQDREQASALYAAEYAIARGKALIASKPGDYTAAGHWTALLTDTSMQIYLCGSPTATSSTPNCSATSPSVQPLLAAGNGYALLAPLTNVSWVFCIHNNAEDPGYLDPTHNTTSGTPNGTCSDSRDPDSLIVIEGYGTGPNSALAHISAIIGAPSVNTNLGSDSYAQEGGGAAHSGASNSNEKGISIGSGSTSF
jgi:hypothetical protein